MDEASLLFRSAGKIEHGYNMLSKQVSISAYLDIRLLPFAKGIAFIVKECGKECGITPNRFTE